jgi:hypothetical protein
VSLTLRAGKGKVVFSWADGLMTATWTMVDSMDEGEIMETVLAMVKFLRGQPPGADILRMPLRPVVDTDDANVMDMRDEYESRRFDHQGEKYRMDDPLLKPPTPLVGWKPVITPPDPAALLAALPIGYEMIGPDDPEGA